MIRLLTLTIFLGTPVATVLTWLLVGPYVAISVLVAVPVLSVLGAALALRARPDASSVLAGERERLRNDLR